MHKVGNEGGTKELCGFTKLSETKCRRVGDKSNMGMIQQMLAVDIKVAMS